MLSGEQKQTQSDPNVTSQQKTVRAHYIAQQKAKIFRYWSRDMSYTLENIHTFIYVYMNENISICLDREVCFFSVPQIIFLKKMYSTLRRSFSKLIVVVVGCVSLFSS